MSALILVLVGVASGVTTALFGFGGGFVAVPVLVWADAALGDDAPRVAVATSSVLMVVAAAVATASTSRTVLAELRGSGRLLGLLALGGALGAVAARHVPGDVIAAGFVAYLLLTIASVTARPGFLHAGADGARPLPPGAGLPIGAIAAFLGVGGSVVTVPLMRRNGHRMAVATALANPLTLAVALPATAVFLLLSGGRPAGAGAGFVGAVDVRAAIALLVGSLPVIVLLRRRGPRLSDRVHARWYVGLLVAVTVAMAATLVR
ncbi:sulfite exporter TauE/SafE family protein [Tsukamurella tyrosinosolvens]|uniref:sulfite exporter TauE/SafE family protein n=1 Tax=Tsukamurella tyrosinosolvens TaxID=57704 RepID=UPI000B0D2FC4|nr:sulfite exporter TauE/SafE family protein [Tsukamurella tyrosinosolvens]MEC4612912.1 sulfite exporter TauE/SafE family protein [Tsukamurella tyrosinosolvens]WEL94562.1 sulfite exporter TauE/SafE family protein [Tsukamurella tyrosinosolvens]